MSSSENEDADRRRLRLLARRERYALKKQQRVMNDALVAHNMARAGVAPDAPAVNHLDDPQAIANWRRVIRERGGCKWDKIDRNRAAYQAKHPN